MRNMVFKRGLVFLIAVLFLLGCARPAQEETPAETAESVLANTTPEISAVTEAPTAEPTPEPSQTSEPSPTPLTIAALNLDAHYANDYLFLWETLETDYPYLPYLRDKGIDVDEIRERYAQRINEIEDDEALLDCLESLFGELRYTAHLGVITPYFYQMLYSGYVLNPQFSSSSYDPWREALTDPALSHLYDSLGETSWEEYQSEEIVNYPEVGVYYYEDCKTLLLTIPTFWASTVERDQDVFYDAITACPEAENIVFDITGNSGGADSYWRQNIVARFGKSYEFRWREFYRDTPLNRKIDDAIWRHAQAVSELADVPEWVISLGLDSYWSGSWIIASRSPRIQSTAKRWVVVDEYVYSASETFVNFCKQTGWATVVGRHTSGDGNGHDPVLVMLPDSGILVRFSNTATESADGNPSIDGTEPDIPLEGESLSGALLELIRSGNAE